MKRKTAALRVTVPIPPEISREAVIALLHTHTPLFALQAFVKSWRRISAAELDERVRSDLDFFRATQPDAVAAPGEPEVVIYSVLESVPIIPHVGEWAEKEITFPSRFQNTSWGVRAQANAPGGIIVRSTYRVDKVDVRDMIDASIASDAPGEYGSKKLAVWQLTEETEVEANCLMLPLVSGDMEKAHKDICQKVIQLLENDPSLRSRLVGEMEEGQSRGTNSEDIT